MRSRVFLQNWRLTEAALEKLNAFHKRRQQNLFRFRYPKIFSNEDLYSRAHSRTHARRHARAPPPPPPPHTHTTTLSYYCPLPFPDAGSWLEDAFRHPATTDNGQLLLFKRSNRCAWTPEIETGHGSKGKRCSQRHATEDRE